MKKPDFLKILDDLGLSQNEAAELLSVNVRTIRRWADNPKELPGPVEQALLAWLRLHRFGLPWRPDGVDVLVKDEAELAEQIINYRNHAIHLDALLEKVKKRGGPATPWQVDLEKCLAILGPMRVGFYRLPNGGFSPSYYSRKDDKPNLQRDAILLEDAYACIAFAIANQRKRT